MAEITESDIDASEVDDSDSDSDSLPPDSSSDSGESVTEEEPVWGTQLHDVTFRHVFDSSAVGPTHALGAGARIIDFFLLFIPMHCIALMCEMTNLYASQIQASLGKVDAAWVPVVEADITTFLGILIIMGLHKGLRSYWSNDEALSVLAIKKAMSRNRFAKIQQYFHLNDSHAELRKEDVGYCIALMCEMTNLYASQIQASLGKVDAAWVPVVEADITTFLGILIIMGLHKGLRSYWSNDEALSVLAIKKAMSRNRFAKIQQYFHLNDSHAELRKEDVGYCIALMCEMTNLYASQIQASLGKVDAAWVPVVEADITTFLGILIIMGLHKGLRSYWSNDEALSVLAIKKAMSRNRFAKIQQYFHLNDSHAELRKEDVGYDRLQKFRPLLSICKETFRANFIPARELSIDEGMVKFKGRLGFVQYMPMKPTKRGIKVWMLASPANGYTHEVDVYCGRSDGMTAEHGLGYNVVMKLSTPYHGKGHHIFYDNFFSSVELLRDLLKKATYACGTMRSNRRGYPLSTH